jgi:serine/threonine protein kinase
MSDVADARETPRPTTTEEERLDELVAEALAALEHGGEPELQRFLGDHPADAPRVSSRVEALRSRGLLDPNDAGVSSVPQRLGDFKLLRELGSGGMGVVYLAEQVSLKRRVALKLLQPSHLFFPHARARFQREIETVARLHHPGIVPVYLVGEDQGLPWFAMERVEGCTLAEVLHEYAGADPRRLTGADLRAAIQRIVLRAEEADAAATSAAADAPDAAARPTARARPDEIAAQRVFSGSWTDAVLCLFDQVAVALAHAHSRGVLHRDLKPSNVMVSVDGRAQIVDFGLALLEGSKKLTRFGTHPGSLPYMSPEQLSADEMSLDVRSDVYSLGVTLYEALTLRPAFDAGEVEAVRRRVLAGDCKPPRSLHRGLDRDAETVCRKAMAVERERRYATATDLAHDLQAAREGRRITARRPGLVYAAWRTVRLHPVQALAATTLLAIAAASFLFAQNRSGQHELEHAMTTQNWLPAYRSVLERAARGESIDPDELAQATAFLQDPSHLKAIDLLRKGASAEEPWRQLEELLPAVQQGPRPEETPLAPLAAITDPRPSFRFEVPQPSDGRPRRYAVTLTADGRPDRLFTIEWPGDARGSVVVPLEGDSLEVGPVYRWSVQRVDAESDVEPTPAEFTVLDASDVDQKLGRFDTGVDAIDKLLRAALMVHLGLGQRALQELMTFPPDAAPADQAQRLILEARAHVLLADAEAFRATHRQAHKHEAEKKSGSSGGGE